MVDALEAALVDNAGVAEVVVDGVRVKYDRKQALEELNFWRRQLARERGTRPIASSINLSGF